MSTNDNLNLHSDEPKASESENSDAQELIEAEQETGKVEKIVEKVVNRAVVQIKRESFKGPLPKPEHLKAYNDICPGAALDILNEFKANGLHVRECEKRALNASIWKVTRGQVLATIIAFTCLIFAFICAVYHQAYWVSVAFITLTGTVVLPFLGFRPKEKKDPSEDE